MVVLQVLVRGSSAPQRLAFGKTFRIGPTPDCDLVLPTTTGANATVVIEDLDVHVETRDGRLNGYPIDPDFLHVLHVDDLLVLDGHRIVFELVCGSAEDIERYLAGASLPALPLDDTEQRLIDDLRADPLDAATLEVYADWLDANQRPLLAEYIRLQQLRDAGVTGEPSQFQSRWLSASPRAVELRLRDLARFAAPWWRALLTRGEVVGCMVHSTGDECPGWAALPAEDFDYRECTRCKREIQYCTTMDEIVRYSRVGWLVVIDPLIPRVYGERAYFNLLRDDDITQPRRLDE